MGYVVRFHEPPPGHTRDWHASRATTEADALERTKRQAAEDGHAMLVAEVDPKGKRSNARLVHPDGKIEQYEEPDPEAQRLEQRRALGRQLREALGPQLGTTITIGGRR